MRTVRYLLAGALAAIFGFGTLLAQDYYTAWVGTFVEVKPQDFGKAREVGFVYTLPVEGNLMRVYVGQYSTAQAADEAVAALKRGGFDQAQTLAGTYTKGGEVPVIQVATRYANRPINWEELGKLGNLNVLLEDNAIKVLTGTFSDVAAAKAELPNIQNMGFADAFVKMVPVGQLLPVAPVATGIKAELIPLNLSATPPTAKTPSTVPTPVPTAMSNESGNIITSKTPTVPAGTTPAPTAPVATRPATTAAVVPVVMPPKPVELPTIRGNIKRNAVLELQKVLKSEGYYNSNLDGYYGTGTETSYRQMYDQDKGVQKYRMLTAFFSPLYSAVQRDALQDAINNLPYDANAPLVIERSNLAVGKGYRAYQLYTTLGPSQQVNDLMNNAIKEAYIGTTVSASVFNYNATYAYQDLSQLLLHLHYLHAAPTNVYQLPCWLAEKHPTATQQALTQMGTFSQQLRQATCDPFAQWPEVQLLQSVALDMTPATWQQRDQLQAAANKRYEYYLRKTALPPAEVTLVENWHKAIWQNIDRWALQDPYLQETATTLRFAYFQCLVRAEDYYMDQGLSPSEARALGLAVVRAITQVPLGRFQ